MNELLSNENDLVFDPFSGSGTVLLESLLAGRNAYGQDANPLACLISKAKTTPLNIEKLQLAAENLLHRIAQTPKAEQSRA
jgi:DNA modification methylase